MPKLTKPYKEEPVKAAFKAHKNVDEVYQTSDGQVFTNENFASGQSKNLENQEVAYCARVEEAKEIKSSEDLKVDEFEEYVEKFDSVEELEAFVKDDKRKGVIEATADRIEKINEASK